MTSVSVEPGRWCASRWATTVVLVLALQGFLVFWLGERGTPLPRRVAEIPAYHLIGNSPGEWLALQDPTLFALPHVQGFSGAAWIEAPGLTFEAKDWTEPPRWFPLPVEPLGAEFQRFVAHTRQPLFPRLALPAPEWSVPDVVPALPISPPSTLRIEGALAERRLLSDFQLPAQPGAELLTNSIVQLLVDARGYTFSAVLLPNGNSHDPDQNNADQYALSLAKQARFEPVPVTGETVGGTTFGTMIFQWQTVPKPTTNSPSANL